MEYKFRGKSIRFGKYVYGYGVIVTDDDAYIVNKKGISSLNLEAVEVSSIEQFTGIISKKDGREIYCGDRVVSEGSGVDGIVVFGNNCIGKDDWGVEHKTPGFSVMFEDECGGFSGLSEEWTVIEKL